MSKLCFSVAILLVSTVTLAQPPFLQPNGKNLARLPDDQIEGTIWEYKGKPKAKPKAGEKVKTLDGTFRLEGSAVFAVEREIKLPPIGEVRNKLQQAARGELKSIKVPSAPQTRRLGQYRKLSNGKIRIDFNDPESLNGVMVIWRKQKTGDVWMGNFTEKKGSKLGNSWIVELRPIED